MIRRHRKATILDDALELSDRKYHETEGNGI